jgi:hypothetical protein
MTNFTSFQTGSISKTAISQWFNKQLQTITTFGTWGQEWANPF